MRKYLLLYISFVLLAVSSAHHGNAATLAEASVGHTKATVGKYDVSDLSSEEQEWFFTFIKGNFFAEGWEQISSEILDNTLDHERESLQARLHALGSKIGFEWCKGNETRKIHTAMLKEWGRELKKTAEDAPHLLTEVVHRIDKEVEEILN